MICIAPVRRWAVVGMVMVGLLVGGCGGKEDALGPTATLPQPTTTTDPYAIPAVIDEPYVNRVLAGLDQAVGDVVRIVVGSRTIPPEAIERLKAIYVGDALQLKVDGLQNDMFRGFSGYRAVPGNKTTTVTRIIEATPSCIFAEVHKDFSAVSTNSDPALSIQWVALRPLDQTRDPMGYNSTRWVFTYDGFRQDLSKPDNPCVEP